MYLYAHVFISEHRSSCLMLADLEEQFQFVHDALKSLSVFLVYLCPFFNLCLTVSNLLFSGVVWPPT